MRHEAWVPLPPALTWKHLLCACAEAPPTDHHLHPAVQPSPGTHSVLWSHTWRDGTCWSMEGPKLAEEGVESTFLDLSTCMCPVQCPEDHRPWLGM